MKQSTHLHDATSSINLILLRDTTHGGQASQPQMVAGALASYIAAAKVSIDIAIYDFRLTGALAETVVGALKMTAEKGIQVRIAYDEGKPSTATAETYTLLEADPAPAGNAAFLTAAFKGTNVQLGPINAAPQLMHSKYVIRDGETVWTGSTNFTDDAWTLQENNIITIIDKDVAAGYGKDFAALWSNGVIKNTGKNDGGETTLDGTAIAYDFSPGDGPVIDSSLVAQVEAAQTRIVIATMILTSPTLLAALVAAIKRGVALSGIYDSGQMGPIAERWKNNPHDAAILADFTTVTQHLSAKRSAPYTANGPHNFMHNKVLVADDTLATGSYNFSHNAEKNAENQLHITNAQLANSYADYIATLAEVYK